MLGCWPTCATYARNHSPPSLLDAFLAVDGRFLEAAQVAAARGAFETLVREAASCTGGTQPGHDRARCVVDRLFASGQLETVAEPGDPESSTVTGALVSHHGNCAALTALALAVAERVDVPMEAVVFPHHVVVRAPGNNDQVFELLTHGATLSLAQLRRRLGADAPHDTHVSPKAFPAYYLDSLAVRFADAGDENRAEMMFEKAIEAGPRVARIRFNYGTFLLGRNRTGPAKEQLRRSVRFDSGNASAWANLGVALARLGETTDARRSFERALRCDPGNTIAAENLKTLNLDGSRPRP